MDDFVPLSFVENVRSCVDIYVQYLCISVSSFFSFLCLNYS